jgi:uncharacterized protein (DUF305 family)
MGFPTRLSGQVTRLIAIFGLFLVSMFAALDGTAAQNACGGTPVSGHACDTLATPAASPTESEHNSHGAMEMDFDLMYIDMMILHHGSVVALANVALPELTDPQLQEMAGNIISAQSEEITQLTEWRTEWYGSAEPMPMDEAMMDQMMVMMPGMGDATDMMNQMDADYQVSTFCAASDPDLAFIELVIPHHQMAIDSSVKAVEQSAHPELAEFAAKVIDDQQAEIDLLNEILAEREGATPEA